MEKLNKNEYRPYGAFKKLVELLGSIPTVDEFLTYTDYKKSSYYKYKKQYENETLMKEEKA